MAIQIPLTNAPGLYAIVDDSQSWALQFRWRVSTTGHVRREDGRRAVYLHRAVMGNPAGDVTFWNADSVDCRVLNLRVHAPRDGRRERPRVRRDSEYFGVFRRAAPNTGWWAMCGGRYLGEFTSDVPAACAFNAEAERRGIRRRRNPV